MSDLYRAKDQDITHVEYVKYLKYPFSSASGRDKETEEWAKSERYVTGTRLQDVSTWNHISMNRYFTPSEEHGFVSCKMLKKGDPKVIL